MKYRRKPVVIDAIQWTGDNYAEIFEFTEGKAYLSSSHSSTLVLYPESDVKVEKGSYIIRIAHGAYSICEEDIFNKTYEPVK